MTSDETTAAEIIVAITASPSEESIICGTDSKQLYTGALSVADIQRSGDQIRLVLIDKIAISIKRKFEFHVEIRNFLLLRGRFRKSNIRPRF